MELILNYKGFDYDKIKDSIINAYEDISFCFKDKLENLTVSVHKNKKEFDKKLNQKTKLWHIASAHNGEIDIIHFDALEKETSHKKEDFLPTLKHEIAHLFIDKLAKDKAVPKWLNEGLASYVSDQYKNIKHSIYIEDYFCEKLGNPKGWDEHSDYSAYNTASLFVSFLAEKYALDKIMKLFSKLDRNYFYPNFEEIFKNVFGETLKNMEKEFVGKING